MIFGKEYDLSLWFLLKVRNPFRRKAIKLIKELPEEFLENIRTAFLKRTESNAGVGDDEDPFYNVRSKVDPNIIYKFFIMCRELYIIKNRIVDGESTLVSQLTLNPNDPYDILHLERFNQRSLGVIGFGPYPKISYQEAGYDLKKTSRGYVIIQSYTLIGNLVEIKFVRPIRVNKMPDEMYRQAHG